MPLRRSLAHLANSCQIEILSTGHQALNELKVRAFDLVIIDSRISDLDSLELAESVSYLDPDVPVILMLSAAHHSLETPARALDANPILRPFKPLEFLRLVDILLHQHLERYRNLARSMRQILASLTHQTQAQHIFFVDAVSETVAFTPAPENETIRCLAQQAIKAIKDASVEPSADRWAINSAHELLQCNQALFINTITENIYLILTLSESGFYLDSEEVWASIEQAIAEIRQALQASVPSSTILLGDEENGEYEAATAIRLYIAPNLIGSTAPDEEEPDAQKESTAVNWQLISEPPSVLDRLKNYC
ncbi:MAG: response regulator [Anaerolineae bacterium]|nr:response regulator [Anaerolineae bacterium]